MSSKNSSSLVYAEEASKTLGKYTAVGTVTGRYIYQHQDMDRYLQFDKTNMNWLVVHQVGSISGFIYHEGGSVCAENSGDQWHVASLDNNKTTTTWQHDPHFSVRCVEEETENTTTKTITKTTTTTTRRKTTKTITTSTQKVEAEKTTSSLSSSSTKVDSTESSSSVTGENTETPLAKPLVSDSESGGSPVTAIIVSLGFLVVFSVLAVIFVHRFRTSWRSGSHGKQLVLETFGLHRNNI